MGAEYPDTSAVILAGGESRRFGREKAWAEWRGRPLVVHVAEVLRPLAAELLVVVRAGPTDRDWPTDRVIHEDPELSPGPLRGIVAGLAACRTPWAWVVAADAPALERALLRALREAAGECESAAIGEWGGVLQPLVSCYARAAREELEARLRAGTASPRQALRAIGFRRFGEMECRRHDPTGRSFLDVDEPGDLDRLDRSEDTPPLGS